MNWQWNLVWIGSGLGVNFILNGFLDDFSMDSIMTSHILLIYLPRISQCPIIPALAIELPFHLYPRVNQPRQQLFQIRVPFYLWPFYQTAKKSLIQDASKVQLSEWNSKMTKYPKESKSKSRHNIRPWR